MPLLADALDACAGMVVNIEIKNHPGEAAFDPTERASGRVVDEVEALGRTGSVVVSSFWSAALGAVRSAGRVGLWAPGGPLVRPGPSIATAVALGCAAVHLPVGLVDGPTVDAAHDAGLAVAAWTVADEDTLAAVLAAGVDTVITDDVTMVRRAVDGS